LLDTQRRDLGQAMTDLEEIIRELLVKMERRFRKQFAQLNEFFGKAFQLLFGGGRAELRLTDTGDALTAGIEIFVQPPGKNIGIEQMSGGEKALIALSIYFAIMRLNPPPFCVLDEVDTALDDVNVTRFTDYLRRMSENTQFIIVTHRRGTMEESDVLYGVTMQEKGVSKLLQLDVAELEKMLKISID